MMSIIFVGGEKESMDAYWGEWVWKAQTFWIDVIYKQSKIKIKLICVFWNFQAKVTAVLAL